MHASTCNITYDVYRNNALQTLIWELITDRTHSVPAPSQLLQGQAGPSREGEKGHHHKETRDEFGEGNIVSGSLTIDLGKGQEPATWSAPAQPRLRSLRSSHFHGVLSPGLYPPLSSREETSQELYLHQLCNRALFTSVLYLDSLGFVHYSLWPQKTSHQWQPEER